MSKGYVLKPIQNVHNDSCGEPPNLNPANLCFLSYFQNEFGEQWLAYMSAGSDTLMVRSGDVGWGKEFALSCGKKPSMAMVLSLEEANWIVRCAQAVRLLP